MSSSRPSDGAGALTEPRWWQPKSLTARLTATMIVLVAVVSLLVAIFTTVALRSYLYERLDNQLTRNADLAGQVIGQPGGFQDVCDVSANAFPRIPGTPGSLSGSLDQDCAFIFTDSPTVLSLGESDLNTLRGVDTDGQPHTVELGAVGAYRVVVTQQGARTVVTGLPTADVDSTIRRVIGWEILVGLLGVLVAAAAGLYLVRRQLAPLRQVAATARDVTQLPLGAGAVGVTFRVPAELTDTDTEVGQVGEALNLMLSHVEAALDARHVTEQQVRQFLADASHELRTPLSTIQGYAELTRRADATDVATLRHAMAKVETESERMAALVDDLLLLARLDSGRPLDREEVDLTRLVVEAVNDARVVDHERRWKLELPDEPVLVVGDRQRLHQVLSNLLSNAQRHTGPGTTVTIDAGRAEGGAMVRLRVHDDGPGMPDALRGREFERFSRGDGSRTRASGGAGLGLSIVKAIVDAHGGSVGVTSEPGDTAIIITLPSHAALDATTHRNPSGGDGSGFLGHADSDLPPLVGRGGSDDRSDPF